MKKPSIEEWLHLGEIVILRLTDCVHIYKKSPHPRTFMPESERQQKTDALVKLLHRIHALVDESDTPTDSIPNVHEYDERVINGLALLFRETQQNLRWLSSDMQKLLESPWMRNFPNKNAEILFCGNGDESEGIGSGHPEHGRLPAALADIQEREQIGDTRHPRQDLLRHGEPRRHDAQRRIRWDEENADLAHVAGKAI
jgi:hypothetical protein